MIFDHCDWLVSYVCLCVYIYITYLYTLYCIFTSNMMKADDKLSQMFFIPLTYWDGRREAPHILPYFCRYVCTAITGATHKYTPTDDSYQAMPDAPRSRYRHAAAAVGGRIFLLGGVDLTDSIIPQVDVFDTTTATWSTLSNEMPNATTDLSAFAHDGKIYVVGGFVPFTGNHETSWNANPP